MKHRFIVALSVLPLTVIAPARAELAAPNAAGVSMGHVHLAVKDVEAQRNFFMTLGGTPVSNGSLQLIQFPGVFINIRQDIPSAGSAGSIVNHFGFYVKNLEQALAKIQPLGRPVEPNGTGRVFVVAPEGVRVELVENQMISSPIEMHHVHLWVTAPLEVQAWYVKMFGAVAGKRGNFDSADIPGAAILLAKQETAQAATKGRAIDHIGFEVKNLDQTVKRLEASGVRMDRAPQLAGNGTTKIAFFTDPWGTYVELTEGLAPPR